MADLPNWVLFVGGFLLAGAGWLIALESRVTKNALDTRQLRDEIGAIDNRIEGMEGKLTSHSEAQIRMEERLVNISQLAKETLEAVKELQRRRA